GGRCSPRLATHDNGIGLFHVHATGGHLTAALALATVLPRAAVVAGSAAALAFAGVHALAGVFRCGLAASSAAPRDRHGAARQAGRCGGDEFAEVTTGYLRHKSLPLDSDLLLLGQSHTA